MNRKVSVAPMMDCTDRHERYFLKINFKKYTSYIQRWLSMKQLTEEIKKNY